eukprot:4179719-Amphidinium_carterae.2
MELTHGKGLHIINDCHCPAVKCLELVMTVHTLSCCASRDTPHCGMSKHPCGDHMIMEPRSRDNTSITQRWYGALLLRVVTSTMRHTERSRHALVHGEGVRSMQHGVKGWLCFSRRYALTECSTEALDDCSECQACTCSLRARCSLRLHLES